jgi:hypothetical protein
MTDTFVILERVNSLYSAAFTQLIVYTVGVIAFVGVIVPLTLAWFQNRRLADEKAALESFLKSELAAARQDLVLADKNLREQTQAKVEELFRAANQESQAEMHRVESLARGGLSHISATFYMKSEMYPMAIVHAAQAIASDALARDEGNMRAAANLLMEAFGKVDLSATQQIPDKVAMAGGVARAWASIASINENGRFNVEVDRLQQIEAKLRQ